MAFLKELIPQVLAPYSIGLVLLIFGSVLLWLRRKQLLAKILVSIGTLVLLFFGDGILWQSVLPPLEGRNESFETAKASVASTDSSLKWVVVLAGGYRDGERLPVPDQLGQETLVRLIEGIAIHRQLPESKLVLSGGSGDASRPEAVVMADVARVLAIDSKDLILETGSHNTEDQARLIRPIVGKDRFVLVTSGFHMPRAIALFRGQGLDPIPAPTGLPLTGWDRLEFHYLYPDAMQLVEAQKNFREYMSFAWLKLRGRI
jgi:uncharacterized SAM-binding protein YcdF (DUF218 family)